MSHNDFIKDEATFNESAASLHPPLDRPDLEPTTPNDLLIKDSQTPELQGVGFPNDEGMMETPIEPPVVPISVKSPYHNGGRGRPSKFHLIFLICHNPRFSEGITAPDISHLTGLSRNIIAGTARIMVADGTLTVRSPDRSKGQRWPSVYKGAYL